MVDNAAATPQQPVISIRISEALRLRLETLKKIMYLKSGQNVSTSEAAKQLLESARDDRLELVDLLSQPTDSLLSIRRKADSGLPLSLAESTLVAHYCALGAESFMNTAQGQISYESLAEILEAFLAAYTIARRPKKSMRDFVYLRTLPWDKQVEAKEVEDIGSDDLRRVVTRTIQMLRNPAQKRRKPLLAVRNLYTLLDEEQFSNIEKLNEGSFGRTGQRCGGCARAATIPFTESPCERRRLQRQTTRILSLRFSRHRRPWKKADTASIWCGKRGMNPPSRADPRNPYPAVSGGRIPRIFQVPQAA